MPKSPKDIKPKTSEQDIVLNLNHMEHSYGHGKKNLAFNFYLLTLLAFSFHQIAELTDKLYQACRKKFGSKRYLWETLRSYIKIILFESWEMMLSFALNPKQGVLQWTEP